MKKYNYLITFLFFISYTVCSFGIDTKIYSVDFSANGIYFTTGGERGKVDIWKTMDRTHIRALANGGIGGNIMTIKFSSIGEYILAGDDQGYVILWSVPQNKVLFKKRLGSYINVCDFSKDDTKLLVATTKRLLILDIEGNITKEYNQKAITSASFNPAGDFIVACAKQEITFHTIENFSQPIILKAHNDLITDVTLSPNGEWIASGSKDNSIYIWKKSKLGVPVHTITNAHEKGISNIQFVNDNYVFSTSEDGEIKLWNIYSGKCIYLFNHGEKIGFNAFQFSDFISHFIVIKNETDGYLKVELKELDKATISIREIKYIGKPHLTNNQAISDNIVVEVYFNIISDNPNLRRDDFKLMTNNYKAVVYTPFAEDPENEEEEEESTLRSDELLIIEQVGDYYIYQYQEKIMLASGDNEIVLKFGNLDTYSLQSEVVNIIFK